MPITRKEMFAICNEIGDENKVKNKIPHWNSQKAKFAQERLDERKELALKIYSERQESREEENLSISRKALSISERANKISERSNKIAISAIISAISAIIFNIILAIIK